MFIATEPTPNPTTLKFLPGREVHPGNGLEFENAGDAESSSPLAARVFAVEGVRSVYLGEDFVSVTKHEGFEWYQLKPLVLGAIMEHMLSGDAAVTATDLSHETPVADETDPTVRQIRELIDARVRPAVARDGGDIIFHGYQKGVVYLHMRGACSGCPSSALTLKSGIENLLKYYVPEVVEVRAIDG